MASGVVDSPQRFPQKKLLEPPGCQESSVSEKPLETVMANSIAIHLKVQFIPETAGPQANLRKFWPSDLLLPQSRHRVDFRGAPRRKVTGQERRNEKNGGYARERAHIKNFYIVEHAFHRAAQKVSAGNS